MRPLLYLSQTDFLNFESAAANIGVNGTRVLLLFDSHVVRVNKLKNERFYGFNELVLLRPRHCLTFDKFEVDSEVNIAVA